MQGFTGFVGWYSRQRPSHQLHAGFFRHMLSSKASAQKASWWKTHTHITDLSLLSSGGFPISHCWHSPCHLDHCWQKAELCTLRDLRGQRHCNPQPPAALGLPWQQQHASNALSQKPHLWSEKRIKGFLTKCRSPVSGRSERRCCPKLTEWPPLSNRHPLMAAQVVKEDLLIIALLLLVVNVYIPSWWRTREKKILIRQKLRFVFFSYPIKPNFRIPTINNHVVSNHSGGMEGSFSWACCWETGTKRCPEPPVHVKYISIVHSHAKPEKNRDQIDINEHKNLF